MTKKREHSWGGSATSYFLGESPAYSSGKGRALFSLAGGTMYVACSTLCFARLPLDRALRLMAELEFSKVDVAITEQGSHLKPSEVGKDVALAAQRIRIGPTLTPAAFTVEFDTGDENEKLK